MKYSSIYYRLADQIFVFGGALCSAAKLVYLKSKLDTSNNYSFKSLLSTYSFISIISFFIYIPGYVIRFVFINYDDLFINDTPSFNFFLFNDLKLYENIGLPSLVSFVTEFSNYLVQIYLSTLTQSMFSVLIQSLTIYYSTFLFTTNIADLQLNGILLTNIGVLIYFITGMKSQVSKVEISQNKKKFFKNFLVITVILMLYSSYYVNLNEYSEKNYVLADFNLNQTLTESMMEQKRSSCVEKIKNEIYDTFYHLFPSRSTVHILGIPNLSDYDHSLVW